MTVCYRTPDAALGLRLLPVARRIFSDTFAKDYDAEPFKAYCDRVYATSGPMHRDLGDPELAWRVAVIGNDPIGYAKLTPLRAQVADAAPGALELQQIYVLSAWQGKGVAAQLMAWATDAARERGATELYLTVFEHNERAKRFHTRHGFRDVGRCTFTLADRVDDDRVWRKSLQGSTAP